MADETSLQNRIIICIPVFDDWDCAIELLPRIDNVFSGMIYRPEILFVDDGSTQPPPKEIALRLERITKVGVLRLIRNVGHQRAIAIGLAHIYENVPCRAVVVMDGDGEDSPDHIPRLIERLEAGNFGQIVFAKRSRRTEGVLFKVLYWLYRWAHYALTNTKIRVGNFSIIPYELLPDVTSTAEVWNHYAASVFKAKLPIDMVPLERSRRLHGKSKMNLPALVTHGLSAMSVFSDIVGARLLVASVMAGVVLLLTTSVVLSMQFFAGLAIPGWTTAGLGILMLLVLQLFVIALFFAFATLQRRSAIDSFSRKQCLQFVRCYEELRSKT
ncbi:MAG: glycosyltransferase [Desulfomonile tiedjei]|nr:glycosyltransferase [Desulfomonile tiedjei]